MKPLIQHDAAAFMQVEFPEKVNEYNERVTNMEVTLAIQRILLDSSSQEFAESNERLF